MAFDDLPLHRSPDPPAPRRKREASSSTARWLIVGAGLVVTGSLLALWWLSRAQPPTVIPAPATMSDPTQAKRRPPREPLELPPLANSDAVLREFVGQLSRDSLLARLLATRDLVRSMTLAVVQIGDGRTPAASLATMRPSIRLDAGTGGKVEPANFERWESAVRALQSIPARDAARVYVNVKPLFDEAYRELGYPQGDFDVAVIKAIRMLNATPEVTGDLVLLRREGYFEHDNPALRSLPPVQKQLILLGPSHRRRVLSWLQQVAAALELNVGG
jgi:Protein of unknown function (DUF3014)